MRRFSNLLAIDDAPFEAEFVGAVPVVGTIYARQRLNGVIVGEITKDGHDAADNLAELILNSKFYENLQLILFQGIALGGFNVIDVFELHARTQLPILVVARRRPNMDGVRTALLNHIEGGVDKWAVIEGLGPMEAAGSIFMQRVGIEPDEAIAVIEQSTQLFGGNIPEPLRVAHLIAGAIGDGQSRGRA